MDYDQAIETYLAHSQRPASVRVATAQWWRKFTVFCQAQELELSRLRPCHLERFQQALQWEPHSHGRLYSINTVDQILRFNRDVLRWLVQAGHLAQDPTRDLVISRPLQPPPRQLSWKEVRAMLTGHDRGHAQGLRAAAILNVLVEADLEVKACSFLQLADVPKLTLEAPTRELLEAYIRDARPQWLRASAASKFLFLNHQGARLGPLMMSHTIDAAAELAGVARPVSVKCLRRSYRLALERQTRTRLPFSPLTETFN